MYPQSINQTHRASPYIHINFLEVAENICPKFSVTSYTVAQYLSCGIKEYLLSNWPQGKIVCIDSVINVKCS